MVLFSSLFEAAMQSVGTCDIFIAAKQLWHESIFTVRFYVVNIRKLARCV